MAKPLEVILDEAIALRYEHQTICRAFLSRLDCPTCDGLTTHVAHIRALIPVTMTVEAEANNILYWDNLLR